MTNSRPITNLSNNTQPVIKETKNVSNIEIDNARKLAKSDLAKYIFDPKNYPQFAKLIASKPPTQLVSELNAQTITSERFTQFKIYTSNQNEYAALFDLPPAQWLAILLEEKINGDDLAALIGSSETLEGAVSGMLNTINELPNAIQKVKVLFFLNNSADASDYEIEAFLKSVRFPQADMESMLSLHHILYNELCISGFDELSFGTQDGLAAILRIKPPSYEAKPENRAEIAKNNEARLKAALRIMKACVTNSYEKALAQLTPLERQRIKIEQDKYLAEQKDAAYARQLSKKLNGELSLRNAPPQHMPSNILPAGDPLQALAELMMRNHIGQEYAEAKAIPDFLTGGSMPAEAAEAKSYRVQGDPSNIRINIRPDNRDEIKDPLTALADDFFRSFEIPRTEARRNEARPSSSVVILRGFSFGPLTPTPAFASVAGSEQFMQNMPRASVLTPEPSEQKPAAFSTTEAEQTEDLEDPDMQRAIQMSLRNR